MNTQLDSRVTLLRVAFGVTAGLAGLDKFFNLLADWSSYVSPLARQVLPISAQAFMHAVGVVELAVAAAILFVAPALGALAASAWLTLVAVNLAFAGYLDVAARDLLLAVAALTLARLLQVRERALQMRTV